MNLKSKILMTIIILCLGLAYPSHMLIEKNDANNVFRLAHIILNLISLALLWLFVDNDTKWKIFLILQLVALYTSILFLITYK